MNDHEHRPSTLFLLRDQYEGGVKAKHNEITKNQFSFEPVINTESSDKWKSDKPSFIGHLI